MTPAPSIAPARHLGMDEAASARGNTYQTVTNDLDAGRALDLRSGRTEETAESAIREILTHEQRKCVEAVCIFALFQDHRKSGHTALAGRLDRPTFR